MRLHAQDVSDLGVTISGALTAIVALSNVLADGTSYWWIVLAAALALICAVAARRVWSRRNPPGHSTRD